MATFKTLITRTECLGDMQRGVLDMTDGLNKEFWVLKLQK